MQRSIQLQGKGLNLLRLTVFVDLKVFSFQIEHGLALVIRGFDVDDHGIDGDPEGE